MKFFAHAPKEALVKITMNQMGGGAVLKTQGELKIGSVADAKIEFVRALAACSELRVDVSELGQCDTAGIQLLLMAGVSARANGKAFGLIGDTASFYAALERVGIPVECFAARTAPDDLPAQS
jgi:ABC-type transporter Mla MlaB component